MNSESPGGGHRTALAVRRVGIDTYRELLTHLLVKSLKVRCGEAPVLVLGMRLLLRSPAACRV